MSTTHTISIPPAFWSDHADRCVEREVPTVKGKRGRIVVGLTGDEVADLYSDAIHYSHAGDFDFDGAFGLASSARATRKAIEQQVADLDEVIRAWNATLAAERAWRDSPEGQAELAAREAERQAALDAVGARLDAERAAQAQAEAEAANPRVLDLAGRVILTSWDEEMGDGWGTVEEIEWDRDRQEFVIWLIDEGHPMIRPWHDLNARVNDLFLTIKPR